MTRFHCVLTCDVECEESRIDTVLKGLAHLLEEQAPPRGIRLRRGHVSYSAQPGRLSPTPPPDDPEALFDEEPD